MLWISVISVINYCYHCCKSSSASSSSASSVSIIVIVISVVNHHYQCYQTSLSLLSIIIIIIIIIVIIVVIIISHWSLTALFVIIILDSNLTLLISSTEVTGWLNCLVTRRNASRSPHGTGHWFLPSSSSQQVQETGNDVQWNTLKVHTNIYQLLSSS